MDEAECNRRGESKILTVFRLFIIDFLSLYHTLKAAFISVIYSNIQLLLHILTKGVHIWHNVCLWCVDYNNSLRSPI